MTGIFWYNCCLFAQAHPVLTVFISAALISAFWFLHWVIKNVKQETREVTHWLDSERPFINDDK